MVERREYLNEVIKWRDQKIIKVITGIRRCGKSTLLKMYRDYLLDTDVTDDQIIFINLEDLEYEPLLEYHALNEYILQHLAEGKKNYIFLDEVQKVEGYEKVVDSLYLRDDVDIYITGSNAYLLSGELATLLSGRYIEISMLPLSFREFFEMKAGGEPDRLFAEYMRIGSFPYVVAISDSEEMVDTYLEGIYNTIIIKDVEERQKRRETDPNKRKVTDLNLLRNIARFLASSIGSPVSCKSIADYITSTGRKISQNTVSDYVEALTEPFVFYPVERYDVVGKQLLKNNQKLYIADLGLRRHLVSRRNYDLGFSLENIIYLELSRRHYRVNVGKVGTGEVDFVVRDDESIHYYQVTASLTDENTFSREIRPLKAIADNYPKTILTLDRFSVGDYEGIKVVNAVDWLLDRAKSLA